MAVIEGAEVERPWTRRRLMAAAGVAPFVVLAGCSTGDDEDRDSVDRVLTGRGLLIDEQERRIYAQASGGLTVWDVDSGTPTILAPTVTSSDRVYGGDTGPLLLVDEHKRWVLDRTTGDVRATAETHRVNTDGEMTVATFAGVTDDGQVGAVVGGWDFHLQRWDLDRGTQEVLVRDVFEIAGAAVLGSGSSPRVLAAQSDPTQLVEWSLEDGTQLRSEALDASPSMLAVDGEATQIAVGTRASDAGRPTISLRSMADLAVTDTFEVDDIAVESAFSPDGQQLAWREDGGAVRVRALDGGDVITLLQPAAEPSAEPTSLGWVDASTLATADGQAITVWSVPDRTALRRLVPPTTAPSSTS